MRFLPVFFFAIIVSYVGGFLTSTSTAPSDYEFGSENGTIIGEGTVIRNRRAILLAFAIFGAARNAHWLFNNVIKNGNSFNELISRVKELSIDKKHMKDIAGFLENHERKLEEYLGRAKVIQSEARKGLVKEIWSYIGLMEHDEHLFNPEKYEEFFTFDMKIFDMYEAELVVKGICLKLGEEESEKLTPEEKNDKPYYPRTYQNKMKAKQSGWKTFATKNGPLLAKRLYWKSISCKWEYKCKRTHHSRYGSQCGEGEKYLLCSDYNGKLISFYLGSTLKRTEGLFKDAYIDTAEVIRKDFTLPILKTIGSNLEDPSYDTKPPSSIFPSQTKGGDWYNGCYSPCAEHGYDYKWCITMTEGYWDYC